MDVIFKVNDTPFLTVSLSKDQSQIVGVTTEDELMAELAFPQVFQQPTVGQLLTLLKAYAELKGNLGMPELIAKAGGAISWISFKPNLNIAFEEA